jgi:hypothetical protein
MTSNLKSIMNFLPSPLPPFPLGRGKNREMAYPNGMYAVWIGHFAEIFE